MHLPPAGFPVGMHCRNFYGNSLISWEDCDDQYFYVLDSVTEKMKNRDEEIIVMYYTEDENITEYEANRFAYRIFLDAMVHNGDPECGDYLFKNYRKAHCSGTIKKCKGRGIFIIITLEVIWRTSKQGEYKISAEVKRIISSFNWELATSDYQKIRDIYDYITKNVKYDYCHLLREEEFREEYYPMRTAYGTLLGHKAICQGIATTVYRLLLEAGIDCRYIEGEAQGRRHAWNIVKLDGAYYNLDATLDLGKETYKWFLKGDKEFNKSHERYMEYGSELFYELYPMTDSDYWKVCP